MSGGQDDGLDALLASLLSDSAPAAEPEPVAGPVISPERQADLARVHAWVLERCPWATVVPGWQPQPDPGYEIHEPVQPECEQLDPEALLEVAASRAWYSGDQEAFEKALARLPVDRAAMHRRLAGICEMARLRRSAGTAQGGRS